jgi:hypothetical protein
MVVLVTDQYALACTAHAMLLIVFLQSLQPRKHRRIFFGLSIFGAECIIAKRVKADRLRLVRIEVFGERRPVHPGKLCSHHGAEGRTGTNFVKLAE